MMRISQFNESNSFQFLKLLQQLGKGQIGQIGKTGQSSQPFLSSMEMVEVVPGQSCINDPVVIANFRKNFDKDGDFINSQGVAGMCIHGKDPSEWRQIIDISEDGKDELFDMVKSEFIEENGVLNGDTTRRSDVYTAYYKTIAKGDRLKAGWTMQTIEQSYREALISAVKAKNPDWEIGEKFDAGWLDNVTRQTVEGNASPQVKKSLDMRI